MATRRSSARLAVVTIDAFAAGLARQAPRDRMGGAPRFEEGAAPRYLAAARAALEAAPAPTRRGGDCSRTPTTTPPRDRAHRRADGQGEQWIGELRPPIAQVPGPAEAALAAEIEGELASLATLFPRHWSRRSPTSSGLPRRASRPNLRPRNGRRTSPRARRLAESLRPRRRCWSAGARWPTGSWSEMPHISGCRRTRRSLSGQGAVPVRLARQRNKAMGRSARARRGRWLADALHAAAACRRPNTPTTRGRSSKRCSKSCRRSSPTSPRLSCRRRNRLHAGHLAALEALGSADAPQALLRLDCRIRHLLSTSSRTRPPAAPISFAGSRRVGSRAMGGRCSPSAIRCSRSIGSAAPKSDCSLQPRKRGASASCRSTTSCCAQFSVAGTPRRMDERGLPGVLGMRSDPGAASSASSCRRSARCGARQPVTFEILRDAEDEAQAVVGYVAAALAERADDVAVLVRARAHLESVLPALRAAGIPFAAVELDALGERVAVQDLVSLTHALVQPADRLAWLAVLRAPWCGLLLPDLFAIVAAADARRFGSIAALMHTPEAITGLSPDGRARLARVAPVLSAALAAHRRAGVAQRVRGAWLALGGGATLTEPIDLDAIERFLSLVAELEVAGDVPDWPALIDALARLYAEPDPGTGARVPIMPLHRAKGLEFDTVILPGLARPPNRGGRKSCGRAGGRGLARADEGAGCGYGSRLRLSQTACRRRKRRAGAAALRRCTRGRRLHLTGVLEAQRKHEARLPGRRRPRARRWRNSGTRLAARPCRSRPDLPPRRRCRASGACRRGARSRYRNLACQAWRRCRHRRSRCLSIGRVKRRGMSVPWPSIVRANRARWHRGVGCITRGALAPRLLPNSRPKASTRRSWPPPRRGRRAVSRMLVDPRGRWLLDPRIRRRANGHWRMGWES